MKPVPTEVAPVRQVQTARASYQYDARIEAMPQSEAAVVLTAVGGESATAWVWDCEVRSQFAADGAAEHVVSYRIQNAGSRQVRWKLPAPLDRRDVQGIWVDDKPAAALRGTDPAADELVADLPVNLKFVTLVLRLSTRGKPLGTLARLQPPLPEIDLPVFARHWRLELPPGYAAFCSGRDPQPAQTASFSLWRCLLGSLGRSPDQSIFNPLRRADWQSALRWWKTGDRPADPGPDAETAGWTQFRIDLADGALSVIVVRRAAVDAGGWTLFLVVVGVGAWGLSRRPRRAAGAGGPARSFRAAAARSVLGHFFRRPAGRPVLSDAAIGAAVRDRGCARGLGSPQRDAQHVDQYPSLRRAAARCRDALRRELG